MNATHIIPPVVAATQLTSEHTQINIFQDQFWLNPYQTDPISYH